jgi:uncharacterized protein YdcH (DUF465 family)
MKKTNPFLARLIDEYDELCSRIDKLRVFMNGAEFDRLSENHMDLLERQILAMKKYAKILRARIELLTVAEISDE